MKKNFTTTAFPYKIFSVLLFLATINVTNISGQVEETFEDEAANVTAFSEDGNNFSLTGKFDVEYVPGWGLNDLDYFVDNYGNIGSSPEVLGSIVTLGSDFYVHNLWLFPSQDGETHSGIGTATITGKLDGAVQFEKTISTWGDAFVNNGFTLVDFSTDGYDAVEIDELEFEVTSGLVYLAIDNFTFEMVPENTLPTASGFSTSSGPYQNITYTFATSMFGYSDADSDPLDHIRITSVPGSGTLYVDSDGQDDYDSGEEISAGDHISKADLDAGNLQYIITGSSSASFGFDVNDGTNYSASEYTATLNVVTEPTVTISAQSADMDEEGGSTTVTATLSHEFGATVITQLAFSGTATLTDDYTRSDVSISISSGTTGSITLSSVSDEKDDDAETIIIDISSVTYGSEDGTQQTVVTIIDDDSKPTASSFTTSDGPYQNVVYTFSTSDFGYNHPDGDPLHSVRVTSKPSVGTLYVDANNNDSFDSGEQVLTYDLISKSDLDAGNLQYITDVETDTSFKFDVHDGTDLSASTYTATLDVIAQPTVTLSVGTSSVGEEGGSTTVTATLSHEFGIPVTVNLAFSGTATLTDDYTRSGTSVEISSGLTGSVTIYSADDFIDDDDETIIIDIESVINGSEFSSQQEIITIIDNETATGITSSKEKEVVVYFNSPDDYLLVEASEKVNLMRVYNISGKQEMEVQNPVGQRINSSGLKQGIYIVQLVMNSGEIIVRKIIKQ